MNEVSVVACPRLDVYNHYFSEEECAEFFLLSGDRNRRMHAPDGMRIVQGALVLAVVATCISESFPDFGPMSIGEVIFRKPLRIGDSVSVILQLVRPGKKIRQVRVQVRRGDEQVVEDVMVTLAHSSMMLR